MNMYWGICIILSSKKKKILLYKCHNSLELRALNVILIYLSSKSIKKQEMTSFFTKSVFLPGQGQMNKIRILGFPYVSNWNEVGSSSIIASQTAVALEYVLHKFFYSLHYAQTNCRATSLCIGTRACWSSSPSNCSPA